MPEQPSHPFARGRGNPRSSRSGAALSSALTTRHRYHDCAPRSLPPPRPEVVDQALGRRRRRYCFARCSGVGQAVQQYTHDLWDRLNWHACGTDAHRSLPVGHDELAARSMPCHTQKLIVSPSVLNEHAPTARGSTASTHADSLLPQLAAVHRSYRRRWGSWGHPKTASSPPITARFCPGS